MPADQDVRPELTERRLWIVSSSALVFVAAECLVMLLLFRGINLKLPFTMHLLYTTVSLLPTVGGGFLVHALFHAWRREGRAYLRAVSRPRFVVLFLVLFVSLVLLIVFYGSLKVMVPLLNERLWDETLWRIDAALLFGLSPNVLLINLLDQSLLLRFVDWVYGYLFFLAVLLSFPLFLPHRDDRLRVSFIAANVLLWSAGAWLYLAFPSMGPAYGYHEVWDAVREQFPVSMYWQKQLIENYQMVLQIPHGLIDPDFNMKEGIGAFPSLHVGFQTLLALYLPRLSRIAGRAAWLLVAITFLGSVLTGWHYLTDSIAGLLLAFGAFILMERVILPVRAEDQEALS